MSIKAPQTVWVRIFASGYKQVTLAQQPLVASDLGYQDFEYELKEGSFGWQEASLKRDEVNNYSGY